MAEKQTTEYVDFSGVSNLYVAKVLQNSASTYEADTPVELAGVAKVKKSVESTSEKVYYSNRTAYIINQVSDPVLEIEMSAIDNETLSYITGIPYDTERGALLGGEPEPTECALMYEYQKTNGDAVYCVYYTGSFSFPEAENSTKADSPVHNGQTITFTSAKTQKAFTHGGRLSYTEYDVPKGDLENAKVTLTDFYTKVLTPDTVTVKPGESQ